MLGESPAQVLNSFQADIRVLVLCELLHFFVHLLLLLDIYTVNKQQQIQSSKQRTHLLIATNFQVQRYSETHFKKYSIGMIKILNLPLKGHGNEADFLGFLQKSVRHRFLTLHFEPFRFGLRIRGDIRNRKTTPRLDESGSRQGCLQIQIFSNL